MLATILPALFLAAAAAAFLVLVDGFLRAARGAGQLRKQIAMLDAGRSVSMVRTGVPVPAAMPAYRAQARPTRPSRSAARPDRPSLTAAA